MNETCEERPPISCHLPPRLTPPYDNIPYCQLYTYVAFRLSQPWCPLRAAARRDAALPPSPSGDHLSNGSPSPAPPEGLAEHARVRTEPRAGANPTDRADRQGQGGPDLAPPNLCRKNREALACLFLWMAPLRLTGRSVAAGSFRAAIVRCARSDRHQEEVTSGELTAGHGIPGTGIGPPQDRPGAAHPRQRI